MELHDNETLHEVNEHIRLIQRAEGLTFGTDAYLLAAYVRARPYATAADLGSGTGIISLLCLSRNKFSLCHAVELQPTFAELIGRNATLNALSDRLHPVCADVRDISAATLGGEVDIVTANPPYMRDGAGALNTTDEKTVARHETAGGIADFCAAAGRLLKHGGHFYCVFRPERLADLFCALRDAHLEPKRLTTVSATLSSAPSLLLVDAVKYAAPGLVITPSLALHTADPSHPEKPLLPLQDSPDKAYIYAHCSFPDKFTVINRKS